MTLGKLLRTLSELHKKYGNHVSVGVDKPSLWDGNGTFEICEIKYVLDEHINECDDDGFCRQTKRGREILRHSITFSGGQNLSRGKRTGCVR